MTSADLPFIIFIIEEKWFTVSILFISADLDTQSLVRPIMSHLFATTIIVYALLVHMLYIIVIFFSGGNCMIRTADSKIYGLSNFKRKKSSPSVMPRSQNWKC